ncbi:MAG: hypothetical protein HY890_03320 [Deltaproteobacteria bacterium]|nr:hypothetical protein [Deltaproteobacteria bacterium]
MAIFAGTAGSDDINLPVPDKNFTATVVDTEGIATKCNGVSWENGKTFFRVKRGKALVTIPFEKIKKAVFASPAGSGQVDIEIVLKSGDVLTVSVNDDVSFFGRADYGKYAISLKNIKEIMFE